MSPRKLTEDDKQEILQLYRNSEATTSTLANRYEVSSSTISRFLKNKLSSTEYEDLIQQKRLARTPRGETISKTKKETKEKEDKKSVKAEKKTKGKKEQTSKGRKTRKKSPPKAQSDVAKVSETIVAEADKVADKVESSAAIESKIDDTQVKSKSNPGRRRRRKSSGDSTSSQEALAAIETEKETEVTEETKEEKPAKLVIEQKTKKTTVKNDESEKPSKNNSLILKQDKVDEVDSSLMEEDDEDDEVNIITLKEMLGEDLEDINDEEDEEDEEDWDEENEAAIGYSRRDSDFSNLEILPLSQATFPSTCYLVIDRSAELIVKPLAEFADLGDIPQDEVRERTLPVFDNHRIAKRFSHRRERVIKVPDGRMLQKTSRYLQDKGITRLLIDGQIYSLST